MFHASSGLLVHRYAGLINYPGWILAIAGSWWWAFRSGRRLAVAVHLALIPYLAILLNFDGWAGGNGSPSRLLVMIIPAFALGLAALEDRLRGIMKSILSIAIWIGIGVTQLEIFIPPIGYESAKKKLEAIALSRIGIDPLATLPAFSDIEVGVTASPGFIAVVWLFVVGLAWMLCLRSMKNSRP